MLKVLLRAATAVTIACSSSSVAHSEVGVVESVKDGDTFVLVDGTIIRLWGIRAPEPGERGFEEAANALASLVVGRSVECFAARRGPLVVDGQLVSWCLLVDVGDIAGWLVTNGYARDWPEYSGGLYAE